MDDNRVTGPEDPGSPSAADDQVAGQPPPRVSAAGSSPELAEAEFRAILQASPLALVFADAQGRVRLWNPAAEKIFGWSVDEALGRPLPWIPADKLDEAADLERRERQGESFAGMEIVRQRKDGARADVELWSSPVFDDAGVFRGGMALIRDLAQEKLDRAQMRFQAGALAQINDAVVGADLHARLTYWNPAAEALFGVAAAEALGCRFDEVITIVWSEAVSFDVLIELLFRDGSWSGDLDAMTADGLRVTVEISLVLIRDSDGKVSGSLAVARNVTERKQAEEALRQSREQLQTLVMAAPAAIIQVDPDELVMLWNPAAEKIFGWMAEETVGRPVPYVSPEMREESDLLRAASLQGRSYEGLELTRRRKDGALVHLRLWSAPLYGPEGTITGIIGIFSDTTQEKLIQEQLLQSQKMDSVGRLAGGIAHDFNNLLTAIIGYAQLAGEGAAATPCVANDLAEIKSAAERAAGLTRQILAFSRRQTLQPRVLSLNQVLTDMTPLLRRTLGEDLELLTDLSPSLGLAEVDPHQLEQAVLNLAVNARDAMSAGGRLVLGTANVDMDARFCEEHVDARPGPYVKLTVTDTGGGMDQETLLHAFEPFFTTKPPGVGTGLGLSTVHGIVSQSGGLVDVKSEPGRGTSFCIYLPRVVSRHRTARGNEAVVGSLGGFETILVVEDEPAVRALVTRTLAQYGYTTIPAGSGQEALDLFPKEGGKVDMLLTDVVLPGGMQGPALADVLRRAHPRLSVLFMSGYPRETIVHGGRLDEGIAFLEKPFLPDALARKVREVLDARASSNQAGEETLP